MFVKVKWVFFVLFIAIVFSGISGCSLRKEKKIGLLLHEMEGRWFADVEYLKKHAEDAGLKLIVKNAGGSENMQLEQARELVDEGVGVIIVVAVNQNTAAGIVRTAHDANTKVIAYDRIIKNADLDYFITYEYKSVGKMLAEYAYNKVSKGNYVMLWGDASDNNARLMREGQEEFLQKYVDKGDINMVYRTFVNRWSDLNAKKVLQKVIDFSSEKIDVVMANNDNIALAALAVFDDNNLERPKVITGQDATLDACRSIMNDGQTMSVYKSTNEMAKEAIRLANAIINDENIDNVKGVVNNNRKDVPTLFMFPQVVDKTNMTETVIHDGVFTLEELMLED